MLADSTWDRGLSLLSVAVPRASQVSLLLVTKHSNVHSKKLPCLPADCVHDNVFWQNARIILYFFKKKDCKDKSHTPYILYIPKQRMISIYGYFLAINSYIWLYAPLFCLSTLIVYQAINELMSITFVISNSFPN